MIEHVMNGDHVLAIIIRREYSKPGITFFTPDDYSQQLAFMQHEKGKIIQPHLHNAVKREVFYTKEVLVLRKGKVKVDFYTDAQEYISSSILDIGDVILLATGGHGFEVLEDVEMFEIKQGPYVGEGDKTRFEPKARK
jgi:hypothetical protein